MSTCLFAANAGRMTCLLEERACEENDRQGPIGHSGTALQCIGHGALLCLAGWDISFCSQYNAVHLSRDPEGNVSRVKMGRVAGPKLFCWRHQLFDSKWRCILLPLWSLKYIYLLLIIKKRSFKRYF